MPANAITELEYKKFIASAALAIASGILHPSKLLQWMDKTPPPDHCYRLESLMKFWLEAEESGKWTRPHLNEQLGYWLMGFSGLTAAMPLWYERGPLNDGK